MENKTKERLRKKLNKKKGNTTAETSFSEDNNVVMDMLNNMNKMLRENPEMVNKVSKCVSNIIDNKNLMETLTNEIKNNLTVQDQTLDNNSETVQSLEPISKQ
jgi:hypothetical protein